jgi:hypothetical protein
LIKREETRGFLTFLGSESNFSIKESGALLKLTGNDRQGNKHYIEIVSQYSKTLELSLFVDNFMLKVKAGQSPTTVQLLRTLNYLI